MSDTNRQEYMFEKEHPFKVLMKMSIPAIIGMFVIAVYNIVDRIFVGNSPDLGKLGLAAAAVGYPIMTLTGAMGLWFANGGSTLFSISWGQRDKEKAAQVQQNAFILSLLTGLFIMIFGNIFINDILRMLGADETIFPLAKEYFSIALYGSPFSCISMFGNNFSRAQGNPKNAMISMIIGAGFNIVFDYILIIKLNMGMRGAALATIGGQFLSAVWQLAYLFSKRSPIPLKLDKLFSSFKHSKKIAGTGLPVFLINLASSVFVFVLNRVAFRYGHNLGLSTIAVFSSIQTLLLMTLTGLVQGQVPIIGYCYGAKKIGRIKQVLKYSLGIAEGFSLITFICIMLFSRQIVGVFNSEQDLLEVATPVIRIAFLAMPLLGLQVMCASVFQATRQISRSSFLNLLRQIILLLPLVLICSKLWGFTGIFIAMPLADVIAFIITMAMLYKLFKRISLIEEEK